MRLDAAAPVWWDGRKTPRPRESAAPPTPEEDTLQPPLTPDPVRAARVAALKARRDRNVGFTVIAVLLVLGCCCGACLVGAPAWMMGAF